MLKNESINFDYSFFTKDDDKEEEEDLFQFGNDQWRVKWLFFLPSFLIIIIGLSAGFVSFNNTRNK